MRRGDFLRGFLLTPLALTRDSNSVESEEKFILKDEKSPEDMRFINSNRDPTVPLLSLKDRDGPALRFNQSKDGSWWIFNNGKSKKLI